MKLLQKKNIMQLMEDDMSVVAKGSFQEKVRCKTMTWKVDGI